MKPSNDILNELREIAPVIAKLDKKNFYPVSEGYFDETAANMVEMIQHVDAHSIDLPPVLASIPKIDLHQVSDGYFASFSDRLIHKIHTEEVAEELSHAAPLLAGLDKKEFKPVPANYFSVFPILMANVIAEDNIVHDTPIQHEISRWSFLAGRIWAIISRPGYSFAMACMVATVVIGGVVFSHSTLTAEEKIFAQMQHLSETELQGYMGKHRDDFDERVILHNINDIEFTHYFDKPENIPAQLKGIEIQDMDNTNEDIID